ncbi:Uncharacterised protein [Mycobacteroides abscessus subsp. massiliense]|uniref:Uncharacterized protein n=1 Tax=Mycobacteroides abscessus TaxID=36809 RepID=A0A0U0ZRK3_9MYCO|nr:hypothetical protein [Mycobacteroides abscessus]SKM41361.1 Uncharacterised protein [Mycobacteroides abscessus subsp. massiliense]MDM2134797.1 hypothetical protein [Mycobacteroides abscessus]CPV67499.1 Uncharacterised protein [Mycobacteroides abscessus]SKQ40125.1 Uncharacterised protein [Mycobacteroides abscessus subsp. massiliense]SKU69016.1 Uncharacterised protein [Mycobacteroides abscessus subsp. massiliense]
MACRHCPHCRKTRERANTRREAIRQIRNCPHCDDYGRLDNLTDCPRHGNWAAAQALNETDTQDQEGAR